MGSEVSGKAALASSWAWMRPGHAGGCGDGLWDVPRAFPSHPLVSSPARAGGLQSWGKRAVRITTPVLRAAKSLVMLREKSLQAWKKSLQNFFPCFEGKCSSGCADCSSHSGKAPATIGVGGAGAQEAPRRSEAGCRGGFLLERLLARSFYFAVTQ